MLAAALALLPLASLNAQAPNCRDDRGQDRCGATSQSKQRAAYGLMPIERLAEQKVHLMRTFFVDGYGNDAGAVTFARAPAQEPRMEVRFARPRNGGVAPAPLSTIIPVATWDKLVAESADFDRTFAPSAAGGEVNICLHAWVATVEAVDVDGRIRRRTEGACDKGLAMRHAFRLAAAAVEALPACALLDPKKTRNDVTRLAECTLLAGDRAAAAQAYNTFQSTWFENPRGADFARALQYHFFEQVEFAWPGEVPVIGSEKASGIWATRAGEQRFSAQRVYGETANRVRIEGFISVNRGGPDGAPQQVPATMLWTRENGFDFRMRSLTSGTPAG